MTPRARAMRDAFDRAFAEAGSPRDAPHIDVLCIAVGGQPCAIRIGDIASLHAGMRIVEMPSHAPELLGVAAIRASVVPIYDLAAALGMAGAGETPRWTVVHRAGRAGFAFEHYEGHVRIPEGSFAGSVQRGHLVGQLALDGRPRLVIDLSSLLTAVETRGNQGPAKEA